MLAYVNLQHRADKYESMYYNVTHCKAIKQHITRSYHKVI
jgi:hypothetical protein